MKAIQIQIETTWFGVEFRKDLFLTDEDVLNIIAGNPTRYQGYYTIIHRVTEKHSKKLIQLAKKFNREHCFRVLDLAK